LLGQKRKKSILKKGQWNIGTADGPPNKTQQGEGSSGTVRIVFFFSQRENKYRGRKVQGGKNFPGENAVRHTRLNRNQFVEGGKRLEGGT